jgi:ppGpp synthetase/RelA/SpoT-type nucleotidyltranferase
MSTDYGKEKYGPMARSYLTIARQADQSVSKFDRKINSRKKIDYLSITGRTKDKASALEKIERKSYTRPETQMTDLSGVRIVVYFESQISQISDLIRESFQVDEKNSMGHDQVLGEDRIGYRSAHFVCSLGDARKELPEYASITNLNVEFQVRTVLQHAWAELAHDGSYKFSGELPNKLQRKLNLYSGMLEVVDQGFNEIALALDSYKQKVNETGLLELADKNIDSINIEKFIAQTAKEHELDIIQTDIDRKVVEELKNFGIYTISDLSYLVTPEFIKNYKNSYTKNTSTGFLRDIMLFTDIDKYFERCWKMAGWGGIDKYSIDFLIRKYGKKKTISLIDKYEIDIQEIEYDFL